jgi:hypothetical protein
MDAKGGDAMIGLSHHDRMLHALHLGDVADRLFEARCRELGLDPVWSLWPSPLQNLADQRARIHHGGRA